MAKNTDSAIKNSFANICIYFDDLYIYKINLILVILSNLERIRNQESLTPKNQIKLKIVMNQITQA